MAELVSCRLPMSSLSAAEKEHVILDAQRCLSRTEYELLGLCMASPYGEAVSDDIALGACKDLRSVDDSAVYTCSRLMRGDHSCRRELPLRNRRKHERIKSSSFCCSQQVLGRKAAAQ